MPGVLLPGLLAVPASGCFCDCSGTYNIFGVDSATPMTGLEISGEGCGESSCIFPDPDIQGACRGYDVKLVRPGSCHLTATAPDGRQATTDVTVKFLRGSCCGDYYTVDGDEGQGQGHGTVVLTFPTAS